jgi:hypothetical protein
MPWSYNWLYEVIQGIFLKGGAQANFNYALSLCLAHLKNRCYDFKNILAEKMAKILAVLTQN